MMGTRAAVAVAAAAFWTAWPAHAQLFTTYNFSPSAFSWITCGSIPGSEGCFGSGNVSGFGHLCAVLEDPSKSQGGGSGSKQRIYFMDSNATGMKDVVLHVFEKTIVVSGQSATTSFTKVSDVSLPLVGGAACQAAANNVVILAGTSKSTSAAYIVKKTLAASSYGGFSPPQPVSSITSDPSGYISVDFGSNPSSGFYLIGPDGSGEEDGGGTAYVIPKGYALTIP